MPDASSYLNWYGKILNLKGYFNKIDIEKSRMELKLFRLVLIIELGLKDPSSDFFWNLFRFELGLLCPNSQCC